MALVNVVKFNAQTNGRDKLCRLLQYMSKFAGWYVDRMHLGKEMIDQFKILENSFSGTRKVMRLGKSIDLVYGAMNCLKIQDTVIKLALVAAKMNQAVYLVADHYLWLIKIGVLKGDAKYLARLAARFWFVTIVFNLIRNMYDIITIMSRRSKKIQENGHSHKSQDVKSGFVAVLANKPVVVDTAKNCSDFLLPLAGLGYVDISNGLQGILGITSSLLAIAQTWDAKYKLTPA